MRSKRDLPTKFCAWCGRAFSWRKKWARDWESVRLCSDACRRGRPIEPDRFGDAILALLARRSPGATLCPSEAARAVEPERWRDVLEEARAAARRLVTRGFVEVTQAGLVVDADTARGPIRIRLRVQSP